jgi:hypothetical protein
VYATVGRYGSTDGTAFGSCSAHTGSSKDPHPTASP